ncbi:hypothetical protein BV25DRAFT_1922379 [Artomyces pyxidatus]|uniref:Uncharacterized protein n=1 Tax=Artomyces pyxidatus TaxID=48021 RepID=A0ACB8SGF8_9AGAM|nr:hypothetical protein BV25DRAFT_1922379 [Artomyces pyxidatus]
MQIAVPILSKASIKASYKGGSSSSKVSCAFTTVEPGWRAFQTARRSSGSGHDRDTLLIALSEMGRYMDDRDLHVGPQWAHWSFERRAWDRPLEMGALIWVVPGQTNVPTRRLFFGMQADGDDDAGDHTGDDNDLAATPAVASVRSRAKHSSLASAVLGS